ncbi:alpha/beta hydrolase [Gammaproteobacteria bacterium]|nr:alpha/beta hydrolase [Gammaproteobacteria bacterium]
MKAGKSKVHFDSFGDTVVGDLYCPNDLDLARKYFAITVAGPLGAVKEQAGGVFAQKLAEKGYVALVFDYRTQGESEGVPKNYENPFRKAEDIENAISFLRTHDFVERDRIGSLGICAGGSYSVHAIVSERRVKAFASVNPYFSLREFTGYNPMITDEIRDGMLKKSNEAAQKFFESGTTECSNMLYPDTSELENLPFPEADAKDIQDYYYDRVDTCWPNFSRDTADMSYEALIKSHALDYAKDLAIPYLGIVGSEAITKPYTERFFDEILHDKKEIKVIEGARHVPTYDEDQYVDQAIQHLVGFYATYL